MADDLTNILDERAAFAARFKGTTNLAQRRRYQEDIAAADQAHAASDERAAAAAMRRAALEDPLKAGTLRLNQQRERRMADEGQSRLQLSERRLGLDEQKLELDATKAQIAQRKAAREMADAKRILENTDAVEQADFELRSNGFLPGTEPYAAGIASAVAANPYADPGYRKTILETARIDADEEQLISQYGKGARMSVAVGPDGRKSFRFNQPAEKAANPTDERSELLKEHRRLLGTQREMALSGRRDEAEFYDAEARSVFQKLKGFNQAAAPAAPAGTATAKPLDRDTAASILKEFGGDKEKARAAARERGLQF